MVVLPYKDRLVLFSSYLQQLVMESLGKELDLDGRVVHQGLAVYGNKGSTDQHAYIQQLRDGVNNFFVTFIEVAGSAGGRDRGGGRHDQRRLPVRVPAGHPPGAAREGARVHHPHHWRGYPFTVGVLIALFERAVALYASWSTSTPITSRAWKPARKAGRGVGPAAACDQPLGGPGPAGCGGGAERRADRQRIGSARRSGDGVQDLPSIWPGIRSADWLVRVRATPPPQPIAALGRTRSGTPFVAVAVVCDRRVWAETHIPFRR